MLIYFTHAFFCPAHTEAPFYKELTLHTVNSVPLFQLDPFSFTVFMWCLKCAAWLASSRSGLSSQLFQFTEHCA